MQAHVDRDYVDGYRDAFHKQPYDPDRFGDPYYRDGMRDGRTHRIDDELLALDGSDPHLGGLDRL